MNNKSQLRAQAKLIRKSLDIKLISQSIITKIINEDFFIAAENIMIFHPLDNEIDLTPLCNIKNKHFYLPRICEDNLEACPYKIGDLLYESSFKTKEPKTVSANPDTLDLIFVPALMADMNHFRLGYGKGFYDRFLLNTSAKTVVVIPKELLTEALPVEKHDKKVDIIITN